MNDQTWDYDGLADAPPRRLPVAPLTAQAAAAPRSAGAYEPMFAMDELAQSSRARAEAVAEFKRWRSEAVRSAAVLVLTLAVTLGADATAGWLVLALPVGVVAWTWILVVECRNALEAWDRAESACR